MELEQVQQARSLVPRVLGTIRLKERTITEFERDNQAALLAIIVFAIVGIANGIAVMLTGDIDNLGIVTGIVGNFLAWVVFAGAAYALGMALLGTEDPEAVATSGGVFRTIGFALAPNVLGSAPILLASVLGQLVSLAGLVWVLICGIASLRVALRISTARAIVIGLIAGFITLIILSIVLRIFEALFI